MATAAECHRVIQRVLSDYAAILERQPLPNVETVLVFDTERDHYLWMQVGWTERGRTHGTTVHVRLRGEQVVIEQDWTEDGVAFDLAHAGISPEQIVFGFHAPGMERSFNEVLLAPR